MNIEYYSEFLELSKCLNYREAARHICVSQSALSKHIVSLEEFYGTPLFVRDKKHVTLTAAGSALVDFAAEICAYYEKSREHISRIQDTRPLVMSGIVENPEDHALISDVIRLMHDLGVKRQVRMKNAGSLVADEQLTALGEGAFDCFVSYELAGAQLGALEEFDITVERLCNIPLDVAVGIDSALAGKTAISLSELSGAAFIHLAGPNFTPTWRSIERKLQGRGIPFTVKTVPTDSVYDYMNLDLTSAFLLLPRKHAPAWNESPYMKVLPIVDADFTLELDIAYVNSFRDEALVNLIDCLKKCYQRAYGTCPISNLVP